MFAHHYIRFGQAPSAFYEGESVKPSSSEEVGGD
jgi:hypothetical protein